MTTGPTTYADVSALVNDVYEGALFTLRADAVLIRTVTVLSDASGLNPRKLTRYGAANPRAVDEGEDVTATVLDRSLLNTLSPAEHADQFFLTDSRITSDAVNVRADAAMELGAAFADYVDGMLGALMASLTGGSIGSTGTALEWSNILSARALLHNAKVPGPYWCALHPFQWDALVKEAAASTASTFANAPAFQDELVNQYFVSSLLGDVIFAVSPNIPLDGTDATGGMYSATALAYDERKPFTIEPQRDASRRGWELNASMAFAYGVYDAARGVKLIGDASEPS
jgi:hypothetical protein